MLFSLTSFIIAMLLFFQFLGYSRDALCNEHILISYETSALRPLPLRSHPSPENANGRIVFTYAVYTSRDSLYDPIYTIYTEIHRCVTLHYCSLDPRNVRYIFPLPPDASPLNEYACRG